MGKATANAVGMHQQQPEGETGGDKNEDDISIDDDEDDEDDAGPLPAPPQKEEEIFDVSAKTVPAAVFGGLKRDTESADDTSKQMGALERLRAAAASRS